MPKRSKHGNKSERKDFNVKKFHANVSKMTGQQKNNALKKEKGENFYRDRKQNAFLKMKKEKPDKEKMKIEPKEASRIHPDRKWFGNTRVMSQSELSNLRKVYENSKSDPFSVMIHQKKLPLNLFQDPKSKTFTLDAEPFQEVFGPNSRRKKPKINFNSVQEYAKQAEDKINKYANEKDRDFNKQPKEKKLNRDAVLDAGTSKRIWEELNKVIDASDVLVEVLDSRDPMGTRLKVVEENIKKNHPFKQIIFILNKCDLIPTWLTTRWIKYLSKEYPTIAFRASIDKPFGKASLLGVLRQMDRFHKGEKSISVGFIGYPNVGKSSIINTLRKKKVCNVAPIPGETKVWQYVALTKRIYLIDSPGVAYNPTDTDHEIVLKGVVRPEKLSDPENYIDYIISKAKMEDLNNIYQVEGWQDSEEFLKLIAEKIGKLKKGGEPQTDTVAKMILTDWQRGHIPYFSLPPDYDVKEEISKEEKNLVEKEIMLDENSENEINEINEHNEQKKVEENEEIK